MPGLGAIPYITRPIPNRLSECDGRPRAWPARFRSGRATPSTARSQPPAPAALAPEAKRSFRRGVASRDCGDQLRRVARLERVRERRRAGGRAIAACRGRGRDGEHGEGDGEPPHRPADYGDGCAPVRRARASGAALRTLRLAGERGSAAALVAPRLSRRAGATASPAAQVLGLRRQAHLGTLVVNARAVTPLVRVFARLYSARFPIRRMRPIDAYGGSDERSLNADNTAAFNCRRAVASGRSAGRSTPTAWRSTSTRSRTRTSRAGASTREPDARISTARGTARDGRAPRPAGSLVRLGRLALGRPLDRDSGLPAFSATGG